MVTEDFILPGNMQRVFRARYKIDQPGLVSHITQRAAGKEPLFLEDSDYLTMLSLLRESRERFDLCYYALCLMPNHVHLLIKPGQKNLAQAMRFIFSRYAAKFNYKYERKGHLFGGPYRQAICLDSTYLLTASIYIHLNPVHAGAVEQANAYRWSSSSLYCQDKHRESFVDASLILQMVHEDQATARKRYRELLQKAAGHELDNALEQEGVIEKFCVGLSKAFPSLFSKLSKKAVNDDVQPSSVLELTQLESKLQELEFSRSRSWESKKVKKYIVEQLMARGYKKTEIAKRLGVSRTTIYNILSSLDTE